MADDGPYVDWDEESRKHATEHDTKYGQYSFHEWTYSPGFRKQYKERYKRNWPRITPFEQQAAQEYLKPSVKQSVERALRPKQPMPEK